MHFTLALLTLVAALIPAITPSPAPSPQSAKIDIHLELGPKDVAGFSNDHKAETHAHSDAKALPVPILSLDYSFKLKAHLIHGLVIIDPKPETLYYEFVKGELFEQGKLSHSPTVFRLESGKLVVDRKAVGSRGLVVKQPLPAILVPTRLGLKFKVVHPTGRDLLTLGFDDSRYTFLGPSFVSGIGDPVDLGFQPPIWPHRTIITWEIEKVESSHNVPFEDYDQDVLAKDFLKY